MAFMYNSKRDRSLVINALSTVAVIIYVAVDCSRHKPNNWNTHTADQNTSTDSPKKGELPDDPQLILFWGNWIDRMPDAIDNNCPFSCEMTTDESRVREAIVVVFNEHSMSHWPAIRFPNQTFIHLLSQMPEPSQSWLADYDGKINLTWNYRHDADISSQHILQLYNSPSVQEYKPQFRLSNKSMAVVWVVSTCNTSSKRGEYVKELAKYIDIDIYGACGIRTCPKENDSVCLDLFQHNYKFYIGFENRICQDYITDQLYKPLRYELIPIVLGGGNYDIVSPPHSYINVRDFESPQALAQYLHHLSHNEEDYYAYFKWKSRYKITSVESQASCVLCNIANNSSWSRPAHTNYSNWWISACDDNVIDDMKTNGRWE